MTPNTRTPPTRFGRRAATTLAIALLAALIAARAAKPLITNGSFEKPLDKKTGELPGWHIKITSVTPIPEYRDPENKEGRTGVVHFKCGCGHMWGTVRPWVGLVCPNCKRMITGLEDSSAWYIENEKWIKIVNGRGPKSKGLGFDLPTEIGNVQGARAFSRLIKVDPRAGYEISFHAVSKKPHIRVFVEGFKLIKKDKEAAEWVKTLPKESNPYKQRYRLKRQYRKHINAQTPGKWTHFTGKFAQPKSKRYRFDYMMVNIYAYLPGQAVIDDVALRRLTGKELEEHRSSKSKDRHKREPR
ncbi:MAG: hypothetical protein CMJ49_10785 [Planctomycetaceae bacterium]|nr:hypothetical protein [Planctomycetaceae bacterium]